MGTPGEGRAESGGVIDIPEGWEGRCCRLGALERGENETCLFLEFWIPANKFIIDIAGQVPEAICGKSGKVLTSLISLWMKSFAGREERN
jgi:hypothetical protein